MTAQLSLFTARRKRDEALARIGQVVSPQWLDAARRFIVAYLTQHGPTAGEDLTDAADAFGLRPTDARHWGAPFATLVRRGVIENCGELPRRKGHGSRGGAVYRVKA